MTRITHSCTPYKTTRPKTFFSARKKQITDNIMHGSGGRTYNDSWNNHFDPSTKKPVVGANYHQAYMIITPFSIVIGVIMFRLIAIL
jgi:hypothetical protein